LSLGQDAQLGVIGLALPLARVLAPVGSAAGAAESAASTAVAAGSKLSRFLSFAGNVSRSALSSGLFLGQVYATTGAAYGAWKATEQKPFSMDPVWGSFKEGFKMGAIMGGTMSFMGGLTMNQSAFVQFLGMGGAGGTLTALNGINERKKDPSKAENATKFEYIAADALEGFVLFGAMGTMLSRVGKGVPSAANAQLEAKTTEIAAKNADVVKTAVNAEKSGFLKTIFTNKYIMAPLIGAATKVASAQLRAWGDGRGTMT